MPTTRTRPTTISHDRVHSPRAGGSVAGSRSPPKGKFLEDVRHPSFREATKET